MSRLLNEEKVRRVDTLRQVQLLRLQHFSERNVPCSALLARGVPGGGRAACLPGQLCRGITSQA